jgi:hypothetical protein
MAPPQDPQQADDALSFIFHADRLQGLRVESEAGDGGAVGQGQVGFAHQQAAGMKDEGQRVIRLLRVLRGRHQGRERGGRLEHGGIR